MDDRQLMARMAQGDADALTELIRRHRSGALLQARRMLKDDALAEDVVQEAFARVYLLRQQYRAEFVFSTYLAVMVRNLCIDCLRRRRLSIPVEDAALYSDSAEAVYLERESRMALWRRLMDLPEQDRSLLTGYALDHLTYQQLARREGMSAAQVRIRLYRIRQKLRKERDEA